MFVKIGIQFLSKHSFLRKLSTETHKMSSGEKTGLKLNEVLAALEKFAPKKLAESWDNTGLLVEPYTPRNITKILLTNDLTEDVALEAKDQNCEMIISYHPPIFAPLKSVVQSAWKEKIVSLLLENRIALFSPHTSWDSVKGGVNDWLASAFPYTELVPITIGEDPNTGAGRFEAILGSHEFETWRTRGVNSSQIYFEVNTAGILNIKDGLSLSEAIVQVKKVTGLQHVRLALGKGKALTDNVRKVALCAGSGGTVLKKVVDADLFLTGEMLHHDVLDAAQRGISVILTNHSDSERGFLKQFSSYLKSDLDNQVHVVVSQCDKDPLTTV